MEKGDWITVRDENFGDVGGIGDKVIGIAMFV